MKCVGAVGIGIRLLSPEIKSSPRRKRAGTAVGVASTLQPLSTKTTKADFGFIGKRSERFRIVELVETPPGFCVVTRESGKELATTIYCNEINTASMVIQGLRCDSTSSGWNVVNLSKV